MRWVVPQYYERSLERSLKTKSRDVTLKKKRRETFLRSLDLGYFSVCNALWSRFVKQNRICFSSDKTFDHFMYMVKELNFYFFLCNFMQQNYFYNLFIFLFWIRHCLIILILIKSCVGKFIIFLYTYNSNLKFTCLFYIAI